MIKIAPSLLAADFSCLREEVYELEQAGADWLHIDVMDGHFVPNITMGPAIVQSIRSHTTLPLDVHLMIENPDSYIKQFADSGADIISVHQEACPHLHRTVSFIKDCGVKAGVVLNPASPISLIDPLLPDIDLVLIMSVNPGFGGQAFICNILSKIAELKEKIIQNGYHVEIEVDGGIDETTAKLCVENGATILVAGSYIFCSNNKKEAIQCLR